MWFLLDTLNLFIYLPFFKPSEEDIVRNINELKKYEWFKNLYKDEKNAYLIIHDLKVRQTIGRFNIKKMSKDSYQKYYQKKLNNILKNK
ncbi:MULTISPECIES: hypothetical protein [unclassified Bacillus (in: firmicutes)]|uniref:hypothetical protein n=1 Tax=unclassified Bacillus (in: firmicutes) TaxID=185979 RepID=UPI0008E8D225|nr:MULTISPECIES: hypothetical protein [unclassified Bacillus (in: firmicutes)]SFJ73451.1 hypothetical protein SAMN04488574_1252 [Bacillus sp. 71mf]SFS69561.1 hypothetical protein SAMN04488145_102593 [Bacillus sp. 103mf]